MWTVGVVPVGSIRLRKGVKSDIVESVGRTELSVLQNISLLPVKSITLDEPGGCRPRILRRHSRALECGGSTPPSIWIEVTTFREVGWSYANLELTASFCEYFVRA